MTARCSNDALLPVCARWGAPATTTWTMQPPVYSTRAHSQTVGRGIVHTSTDVVATTKPFMDFGRVVMLQDLKAEPWSARRADRRALLGVRDALQQLRVTFIAPASVSARQSSAEKPSR